MRRGTLVVGGSCGDAAGFNMIAGSILVFGSCGIRTGAGMRRGTIGLFGPDPTKLLPTFRPAGRFRPLFLRLLFRELAQLGFPGRPRAARHRAVALPWRSGRPGQGRGLDESELTESSD